MSSMPAPVRVSPVIKTVRWGGLVLGILYGSMHYNSLSKKETLFRAEEEKRAVIRNAELAREKERLSKVEMSMLAEQVGISKS